MDSPDGNRFPDLLGLVKSWIPLRTTMSAPNSSANPNHNPNTNNFPRDFWMPDQSCRVCYDCDSQFTLIHRRHHCRLCGRVFCSKCTSFVPRHPKTEQTEEREKVRVCNFCLKQWEQAITGNLVLSPTVSSTSLVSTESRCTGHTTSSLTGGSGSNQNYDSAPGETQVKDVVVSDPCENYQLCLNRSDDEDEDYFTHSNDSNFHDNQDSYQSDKYTNIIEQNTSLKPPSSPVHSEDQRFASSVLFGIKEIEENMVDIENNRMLWVPPEADDGEEDEENGNIDFEELENNGDWGYNRCSSIGNGFYRNREKSAEEHKKVMKNVVEGHFKALITQLLEVENISIDWLDIITCLAWEAASLLRPDMSKGGGMDPGGYVKIKCIASGCPSDSAVVKGVVCKKNVAHRRMRLEMKKPRILILGGALEYQRVSNLLSSFDTLLHQEMEYLRMAVAKIQAHNPNILLVEKAVSRSAQDMFLDQNISLVLNIKRPLLERISRCTGAQIVPSIDHLSNPKLGSCERFHVEKFIDKHGCSSEGGKQVLKTLMFFEDCPRPLGCTILLKGARSDELKKVKHVVQYGVFAAYHLALETSFLADEGATLPELPLKAPVLVSLPEKPKASVVERSISLISPRPAPEKHDMENNDLFGFLSESFLSSQATVEGVNRVLKKAHDYTLDVDISGGTVRDDPLPSPSDHQSILVSLSSRCDWKKTVCESPHLLRIKYYGAADRPLGRFLREQLFDQSYLCRHCDMPSEAHVYCYTHRLGSLTISVRKLPEAHLPDGKIWMWHRCLKCSQVKKLPPANKRVVMSDAAWGLSFGKFLELSFSNHVSASRVASCGHSLHRDCLRFYGFGRMVACFRYAPIKVHNVYLPPSKLDFGFLHQEWVETEAKEVVRFVELTFKEISNVLEKVADRGSITGGSLGGNEKLLESWWIINELDVLLQSEKTQFQEAVQRLIKKETKKGETVIDILDVNKLRRQLLLLSYLWDQRLKLALSSIKDNLTEETGGLRRVLSEGEFSIIGDVPNALDAKWRGENEKELDGLGEYNPSYLPIFRDLVRYGGAKLFVPIGVNSTVIPLFDDEPTSIIAYALVSHDYHSAIKTKESCVDPSGQSSSHDSVISDDLSSDNANHIRVSFGESGFSVKAKYTVFCYYAKCFESLRKKCCPSELDFVRSLSRCKKWGAQGGKSNVFFAKSLDDRFIIKQVTKTELESFIQFAPEYFKYVSESIGTKSPTCLAKILGIYQVTSKQGKGGKETKMDLLVMENLLFGRNITRLYDLKGSCRSRYNSDQSGNNKVLLDQNLIEMMPTSPIFVGNKAKRLFERAIWNDTSFLASIDVMDYSLLVGVDEERHELVLGIIDFMRQYTWDKHLETWAKSSGILGGPKNTSPTVISPKEYKKRFRKAMSAYFIVVPDQWPSSFLLPSKSFSDLSRES